MGHFILAGKFEFLAFGIMLSKADTVTFPFWKIVLHIVLIILVLGFARRHQVRRQEKYLRELIEASQKRFLRLHNRKRRDRDM